MVTDLYTIIEPEESPVPILISVPHSGTGIPESHKKLYDTDILDTLPDTDWIVDELYGFASSLGITMIKANYSRYFIDLNRPLSSKSLYSDRATTPLTPNQTFDGRNIYKDGFNCQDQDYRIENFYHPYYHAVETILHGMKKSSPHVLLFDAHSIDRLVPSIYSEPFADVIFGTNSGRSCHPEIEEQSILALSKNYNVELNEPFKGGNITRSFGDPDKGINAIQLEMSKDLYLDPNSYQLLQPNSIQQDLISLFEHLSGVVDELR